MNRFLLISLTLTATLSLKIRIPKNMGNHQNANQMNMLSGLAPMNVPGYNQMQTNGHSQMQQMGNMQNTMTQAAGFVLIRNCDPVTQTISTADLLSIFSNQMFQTITNNQFQILLIRHESERNYSGAEHLVLYRLQNNSSNEVIYYGLKVNVSHSGVSKVRVFLQSSDLNQVIAVIGFSDQRVFNYGCQNFQQSCVSSFLRIVARIYTSPVAVNFYGQRVPSFVPAPANFLQYLNGNFNPMNNAPNFNPMTQGCNNCGNSNGPVISQNDSPFHTIKANIKVRGPDGSVFKIGSAKPKKD